jgi:hypothetical protein
VTLPVKPSVGVTVNVEIPVPPGAMVTGVLDRVKFGPAVTVTGTVTLTGAPMVVPLEAVPMTVTTKLPGSVPTPGEIARLTVTGVVVPEIATDGEIEQGELADPRELKSHCRATVPVKLALGVIVMVELPVDPASTVTGVLVIVKTPQGFTSIEDEGHMLIFHSFPRSFPTREMRIQTSIVERCCPRLIDF